MKMTITPRFDTQEIINTTIKKDWFEFQNEAFNLGEIIRNYMQAYINTHRHRRGGTGRLAKSITFKGLTGAGFVSWGIGNISRLPAYWYVINYGKMVTGGEFIPARGKFVPGSFEGNRPISSLKGGVQRFNYKDGSGFGMKPGIPVRPINYIQATRAKLDIDMNILLAKFKGI